MSEKIIFYPGTLEEVDGKLIQTGNKCKTCGKVSFPKTELCPFCAGEDLEKVPLSEEGTVFSHSVTRMPVGHYQPPTIGAYVDLPEGTRVYGQIHADEKDVKNGMKVKVHVGSIWTEADGTEVYGYYYEPSEGGDK